MTNVMEIAERKTDINTNQGSTDINMNITFAS